MKIRSCFSEAEESEKVNCVPASAAAQHIEASINLGNSGTSYNPPVKRKFVRFGNR